MKKLLLSFLALVVLGVGAYLWANWISVDEIDELIAGNYELVLCDISLGDQAADSIIINRAPARGAKIQLHVSEEGKLTITTDEEYPIIQSLATHGWWSVYTLREKWFTWRHCLSKRYASEAMKETSGNARNVVLTKSGGYSKASLGVYFHRVFVADDVITLGVDIDDPTSDQIYWQLLFYKR